MITPYKILFTSILGASLLGACQSEPQAETEAPIQEQAQEQSKKTQSMHWEYSGDSGPDNWANISDKFKTCAAGKLQSPFNITADISAALPALGLNYQAAPMKIINNGHTIQADQAGAGQLVVDGTSYDLLQFHFHAGSEYTIDGKAYPLEVHLVHASSAGALAVVGVMFEEGEANAGLDAIWANMPATKGENMVAGQTIDVNTLLPDSKTYYRFMGSLTTPPCSEGVNWHMMQAPITASKAQIEAFTALYPMNARPLQDENNRLVVLGR